MTILTRRPILAALAASIACSLSPFAAHAAESAYPDRPITVVVPFAAGGNGDILIRVLSPGLTERLGQPIVVDNRPGAGGLAGSSQVARANPDGYTLLLTSNVQATNMSLIKANVVNMVDDLDQVSQLAAGSALLMVRANSELKSIEDLVRAATAKPNALSYSSSGPGSTPHLATALMAKSAGIQLRHIPYKGASQAVTDLLAGRVDLAFINSSSALGYIDSGQMRALGVSSKERSPITRNLPTIAETISGFEVLNWQGLAAPKGTPRAVIDKFSAALRETLKDPKVESELAKLGIAPTWSTPEDMTNLTKTEVERWRSVITEANITLN